MVGLYTMLMAIAIESVELVFTILTVFILKQGVLVIKSVMNEFIFYTVLCSICLIE